MGLEQIQLPDSAKDSNLREAKQALPLVAYLSQDWFEVEKTALFGRTWNYVGFTFDIPEPGDYLTVQAGPYPLFVMRDKDGEIKAFHNSCRHRGTRMLTGTGKLKGTIVCPYHSWTYGLDGSLRGVPRQKELFPDLDKSCLGLKPASVGNLRGMLFVHPDPEPAEDFDAFLAGCEPELGPHYPEQLLQIADRWYQFDSNWKMVAENYMDAYHLPELHPVTAQAYDHININSVFMGRHWIFSQPLTDGPKGKNNLMGMDPIPGIDVESYGNHIHMLFPNIGWVGSASTFSTFHIIPVAAGKTLVHNRLFVTPMKSKIKAGAAKLLTGGSKKKDEKGTRLNPITLSDSDDPLHSKDIMLEDMWACSNMYQAMQSPAFEVGPMAPFYEATVTAYQNAVLDFMTENGNLKEIVSTNR